MTQDAKEKLLKEFRAKLYPNFIFEGDDVVQMARMQKVADHYEQQIESFFLTAMEDVGVAARTEYANSIAGIIETKIKNDPSGITRTGLEYALILLKYHTSEVSHPDTRNVAPEEIVCKDCLAHYPAGYDHVCPPWMKALVAGHRARKEEVTPSTPTNDWKSKLADMIDLEAKTRIFFPHRYGGGGKSGAKG